jgi:hypothetical protein
LKNISVTVDVSVWGKELIIGKSYKLPRISLEFFLQSVEAVEFHTAGTYLNLSITVENYTRKINKLHFCTGSYGPCLLQDLFP